MVKNIIEASYREGFDITQDNPLIWALPNQKTEKELQKSILQMPFYSDTERELDKISRLELLSTFRQEFFLPVGKHYQLYLNFYKCLRQSYQKRNPLSKEAKELYTGNYHNLTSVINSPFVTNENSIFGFTLLGIPGIGKTSSSNQILKLIPPVLSHSNLPGVNVFHQVVYLKVECPKDGSIKQLCTNFFEALDNSLALYTSAESNFADQYRSKRYTVSELTSKMAKLAATHNLGVLIIDEIQHLNNNRSVGSDAVLNFLVELNNKLQLPVFLIGTPDVTKILQKKLRLARRCGAAGSLLWEPLLNGKEWQLFLKALWKYQWTQKYFPLTHTLSEQIRFYSHGIIDYTIKLFEKAQERAIVNGKETVDSELIDRVVKEELWMEKPALQALQSNDPASIRRFEDIYIPSSIKEAGNILAKADYELIRLANIISHLTQLNMEAEKAKRLASVYLEKFPELDASEIVVNILIANKQASSPTLQLKVPKQKARRKPKYGIDSLPNFFSEDEECTYQNLKAEGYIKDPYSHF